MIRKPVKQLSPEVARKIAAGEVIDRPNAIVRELLDNAVDSGADKIFVEIEEGGIGKIRISDNGCGFSKEDLLQCARPHATSKISDAQDLLKLTTLGFRGEALASMAAVSRLSVASGSFRMHSSITEDHVIEEIPPVQNGEGSIIQTEGLFENFPARRLFLKRPATEATLCKDTFIEKTLPRPDIAFRFTSDGVLKIDLEKNVSLSKRFIQAMGISKPEELFFEIGGNEGDEWSFRLVIGEPSIYRNDRKHIFIFVNGRKITEYSLIQAIEYGCQGFFPNGVHPVACLFVTMKSDLVDFNIHPAKKEARFKDIAALHHCVSTSVKNFFRSWTLKNLRNGMDAETPPESKLDIFDEDFFDTTENKNTETEKELFPNESSQKYFSQKEVSFKPNFSRGSFFPETKKTLSETFQESTISLKKSSDFLNASLKTSVDRFKTPPENPTRDFGEKPDFSFGTYNSSISINTSKSGTSAISESPEMTDFSAGDFSVGNAPDFMCDKDGFRYIGTAFKLFLICEFKGELYLIDQHAAHERLIFDQLISEKKTTQKLLVPYRIKTDSEDDEKYLKNVQDELLDAGFKLEKAQSDEENNLWLITEIPADWKGSEKDLIKDILETKTEGREIAYRLTATRACKKAVKDGYILDRITSAKIAKEALMNLKDPHCPHGRPVWTKFSREKLFELVRRT